MSNEEDAVVTDEDSQWTTLDTSSITENEEEEQDQEEQDLESNRMADSKDDPKPEESKKAPKKPSRAEQRIKQLVQQKKEAEQAAQEALARVQELQKESTTSQKEGFKSQLGLIDSQIESIKRELKRAKEDGDTDTELDLQDKLDDLRIDKRVVQAQDSRIDVTKEEAKAPQEQMQQVNIPEVTKFWLEDNDWAVNPKTREDRKKVRYIRKLSKELLDEGFSELEDDFYDEIDERLEKEFGSKDDSVLDYKQDQKTDDSPNDQAQNSRTKRTQRQSPVAGASRSSAPTTSNSKKTPKPTAQDKEVARKLNLPIGSYMKSKMKYEARQKDSETGWTTLA